MNKSNFPEKLIEKSQEMLALNLYQLIKTSSCFSSMNFITTKLSTITNVQIIEANLTIEKWCELCISISKLIYEGKNPADFKDGDFSQFHDADLCEIVLKPFLLMTLNEILADGQSSLCN